MNPKKPLLRHPFEHMLVEVLESEHSILIAIKLHDHSDPFIDLLCESLLCHERVLDFDHLGLEDLPHAFLRDNSFLHLVNVELLKLRYHIQLTGLLKNTHGPELFEGDREIVAV